VRMKESEPRTLRHQVARAGLMYSSRMRFTVRPLRRRGLRLTRPEIAASQALTGDLVMSAGPPELLSSGISAARSPPDGPYRFPLLDPVLIKMTSDELVLHGIEIEAKECREWQHLQGWWATEPDWLTQGP